jgi:hypothetical protein
MQNWRKQKFKILEYYKGKAMGTELRSLYTNSEHTTDSEPAERLVRKPEEIQTEQKQQ